MNILHDIPWGKDFENINVIIEINKGSKNKYEIDKASGIISLDRVLHSAQDYPFDYGFVPQTHWHDGDALDVVLLTTYPLFPGCLVSARPVGVVYMVDGGERDEKIIAVPVGDPRWSEVKDLADINPHTLKEIEHFFMTYKLVQKKQVEITGIGDKKEAVKAIEEGVNLYTSLHK